MKKFFILFYLLFVFSISSYGANQYYLKKINGIKFICSTQGNCYFASPKKIKIKEKTFTGFGGYHYYDLNTYKYNKKINKYTVDIMIDRDASTDNEYYSKSPYDNGYITHLLFSISYNPVKKIFKASYKGFITSKTTLEYKNGKANKMHTKYLNVYYDDNEKLIPELNKYIKYFDNVIETFDKPNGAPYGIEITQIIPRNI